MANKKDSKTQYFLGLDVGISSIGWAVMARSADGSAGWLDDFGVRLFETPVEPKTQQTLTSIRRGHRSTRRNIRRARARVERLKDYLIDKGVIEQQKIDDFLFLLRTKKGDWERNKGKYSVAKYSVTNQIADFDQTKYINFYYLANQALKGPIRPEFLSYVLLYLARHRGYINLFAEEEKQQGKKDDFNQKMNNSDQFNDYSGLYEYLLCENKKILKQKRDYDRDYPNNKSRLRVIGARNTQKKYLDADDKLTNFHNALTLLDEHYNHSANDGLPFAYFDKIINNILQHLRNGIISDKNSADTKDLVLNRLFKLLVTSKSRKEFIEKARDINPSNSSAKKELEQLAKKIFLFSFVSPGLLQWLQSFFANPILQVNTKQIIKEMESIKQAIDNQKQNDQLDHKINELKTGTLEQFSYVSLNQLKKNPFIFKFEWGSKQSKQKATFMIKISNVDETLLTFEKYKDQDWKQKEIEQRNKNFFLFRRSFVEKNIRLILDRQARFNQQYPGYRAFLNEDTREKVIKIICRQRTFEEGPGFNKKSKGLKINRYYGYGEKSLSLTAKKSDISGRQVGFRASEIGDLYNACEEFSKITVDYYKKDDKNQGICKDLHQAFLTNFSNYKSSFWKKNEKSQFLSFSNKGFKEWVKQEFDKNGWSVPKWWKFVSKKPKKDQYEYINISPKVYGLFLNLVERKYINANDLKMDSRSDWKAKTSKNNLLFNLTHKLFLFKTPNKIVEEMKSLLVPEHEKLFNFWFSSKVTQEERNRSARDLSNKVGSGMCNLTFQEMTSILYKFWQGFPTSITRQTRIEKVHADFKVPSNWKFLGTITDPNLRYNRTVFRSINQLRKVLKALFKQYQCFQAINIETGRDLNMGPDKRKQIENEQKNNRKNKENDWKKFLALNLDKSNFSKYRLWIQQEKKCIYCDNSVRLKDAQIDHVLPWSKYPNDSISNKVVACSGCNKAKGNAPALKFVEKELNGDGKYIKKYIKRVETFITDKNKRRSLLLNNFNANWLKGFSSRSLNDNRYISRYFYNYIKKEVKNKWNKSKMQLVTNRSQGNKFECETRNYNPEINSVNGYVTSRFRKKWFGHSNWGRQDSERKVDYKDQLRGLSDFHHAVDAMVLASFKSEFDIQVKADQLNLILFINNNKQLRINDPEEYKTKIKYFVEDLMQSEKYRYKNKQFIRKKLEESTYKKIIVHPVLGDRNLASDLIDRRIPVKLDFIEEEKKIEISKVLDERTYLNENKSCQGNIHYPYISYMVDGKIYKGKFGKETILKKKKAIAKDIKPDSHGNYWEKASVWGFYYDGKKVKFVKRYEIYNCIKDIRKVDVLLPYQPLIWKIDNSWKVVFYTGKSNKRVCLKQNGINKHKKWLNFKGDICSKQMLVSTTALMNSGLKKVNISILGYKTSVKNIRVM